DDLDRGRTGLARFYLATVSNLLRRNRLLTRDHYPTYTTALTVTAEDERRWRELLGVPADAPRIPLTVHTRAWTPLLTRLLEDLGVGARHLRHVRTRLTHHPDDPLLDLDTTGSVQVRLT